MAPLFPSSPSHTTCSLWLHATLIVATAWPHTVRRKQPSSHSQKETTLIVATAWPHTFRRRHGFGDLTMYGNSIQHSISSCGTMVP